MTNTTRNLVRNMAALMRLRQWDQKTLSAKSGLSEATISRLLGGNDMYVGTILAVADAFKVEIGALFVEEGGTTGMEVTLEEAALLSARRLASDEGRQILDRLVQTTSATSAATGEQRDQGAAPPQRAPGPA